MTKPFAPLLAKPVEFKYLDYTNLWVSPKLDGVRAVIRDGIVLSRKLLPIPNKHVQSILGNRPELEGYDGELICGPANADNVYTKTFSATMAVEGVNDVIFHAFDHITNPTDEYWARHARLKEQRWVVKVPQHPADSEDAVLAIERMYLEEGLEGVMLRTFSGPRSFYKFGRSTSKECTLLKLKRFESSEAVLIGSQEQMHNGNEATKDELGRTKRSSHAENKTGKGTLGALICRDIESGVEFNIGTGFDDATKQDIWNRRGSLEGSIVKYKSFKIGVKDAPRFPVFLGFRSAIDM
jgi:DNA ligase-1